VQHQRDTYGVLDCAVSLRYGAYWTSSGTKLLKRDLASGAVLRDIDYADEAATLSISIDQKFVLVTGTRFSGNLQSVNVLTAEIVDSGLDAEAVTVCNDGTIVASLDDERTASFSIDAAGQLTLLNAFVDTRVNRIGCSPGSDFIVVLDGHQNSYPPKVISYALPLTGQRKDVVEYWESSPVAVAFNPANNDVFILGNDGVLSVYPFDTIAGTFGDARHSVTLVGQGSYPYSVWDVTYVQFVYGKLFIHEETALLAFDGDLNLLSSSTMPDQTRTSVCVSEGTLYVGGDVFD
jgi:hypothetical protein